MSRNIRIYLDIDIATIDDLLQVIMPNDFQSVEYQFIFFMINLMIASVNRFHGSSTSNEGTSGIGVNSRG